MYKNKIHNDENCFFSPYPCKISFDFHDAKDEIAEEIVIPPKKNTHSIFSRLFSIFTQWKFRSK